MSEARTARERFENKTDRSGGEDACHLWKGAFGQFKTPTFMTGGKSLGARRWLWEQINGPLPPKMWVTTTCKVKECVNPKHMTLRAHNDNLARFWEKVQKTETCWNWTGYAPKGYGVFYENRRAVPAHRFSWKIHFGPIEGHVAGHPELEWCVCHRCDNPRCVNPDHLFLGRDRDNIHDCIAKGRFSRGPEHAEKVRQARLRRQSEKERGS